ncbi:archaemetzincin-2 isoform x1 [Stylonychia lemnae]|uniref:Archaemetzincin-2 isoform x1 n=1 Tax=Stylonychia lemnae TaxID=5949 RepID=A0A078AEJ3_STYLE|nr:archaemetzincin-2 isoform x1 [Stylonychia lemnae]|eukprot:CDW79333.1 archaemetzincin-2 isoform x1 [Stylonychia lemnae]
MQRRPQIKATQPIKKTVNTRAKSQAPAVASQQRRPDVGEFICNKQQRLEAIGDFRQCKDKCLKHILTNAEKLFQPKKIHQQGDWLISNKEKNQTFESYQKPGVKNLVTPQRNKIYIFVIDPKIDNQFAEKLRKYCTAFYTDMIVEIKRPESETFLEDLEVPNRESLWGKQYNAISILNKVNKMVPSDAYCMLTVTMQDIYPYDSWLYVFGWANYVSRTGVFSFVRYQSDFSPLSKLLAGFQPEPTEEQIKKENNELLENACYVMVHEIGHMYGLTHCTFYECIMNGFNSFQEQKRFKRYLCPVCLRKLQSNMQFDVKRRFRDMQKICEEYEFQEMAEYYAKAAKY